MTEQQTPNYVEQALKLFAACGDTEAVVCGEQRLSYTEFRALVLRLAAALRRQGVRTGAGVALLVRNRPESIALQLALHLLGCRTVWIAAYAPEREQAEFVELAKVEVLIYDPSRSDKVIGELAARTEPLQLLCTGPDGAGPDVVAAAAAEEPEFVREPGTPEPSSLFYTGGTAGKAKLVHHEHRFFLALLAAAGYYRSIGELGMRHLSTTGFVHVSGQMPVLLTLCEDGTVFLAEGVDLPAFLGTVKRERVTSVFISPARLSELLDSDLLDDPQTDTSSLRYLNTGGGPVSPTRLAQAIERFGPVVRPVYGLSEMPLVADQPFMVNDPEHPQRLASVGRPFADARVEIRGEKGEPLPTGEVGEVCAAGSLMMSGYWNQPDMTQETLVDGLLHTGDLGYLDQDGYLYLVDRKKDMIITTVGAANVYTRPVEDSLAAHPQVREAAVIGVPDPGWGELVHAFVVPVPGGELSPEELAAELKARVEADLTDYHVPRTVEFVDALPRTPLDKIDKAALRARFGLDPQSRTIAPLAPR
ncbi:AMP-binding protein [Kitasatospora sp. NBC_01287]|uniref:AMP-binding protein n=1 Tax=Kitasatospora sp. NBC_01287 TaxID=2903573 RepID=UPI0022595CC2|nr:AMP-binding protein [Kitasatospora sp. NBC_01287]MCX4744828.1 AMP-binding protein [Kitasatospora sp. NBC_01287]